MSEPDWRLTDQETYLTGVTLRRAAWKQSAPHWDHDHCSFCWAKFAELDDPEILREGWTTSDEYYWICDSCFEDFRERFLWVLAEQTS
jgi:hypothetical protein